MARLTMTAAGHPPATTQHSGSETLPATHIARRDQAMTTPATVFARGQERPVAHRRTAVVVGVLFLSFTVTFFIGNTLIHSYFSSATKPAGTLIIGVLLIGLSGLADAAVGLAMRPVLTPYAPVRSQVYFVLRVAEGLAVLAACAYFLTSRSQWNDYALPAYALSAVAGLVLTPVLLTSRLVPWSLSVLGIVGYALLLAGVICNLLGIADIGWHVSPAGIVFLAPGGLFELLFPLLLIARGFSAGSRARPGPVRTGSARHRDVTAV
jgi:hypothetical protein